MVKAYERERKGESKKRNYDTISISIASLKIKLECQARSWKTFHQTSPCEETIPIKHPVTSSYFKCEMRTYC